MQRFVPLKNIEPVLVDVKNPKTDYNRFHKFIFLSQDEVSKFSPASFLSKKIFFVVGALIIFGFGIYAFLVISNLRGARDVFAEKSGKLFDNFGSAVQALKKLSPNEAKARLDENKKELEDLESILDKNYGQAFFGALGSIIPLFKEAGGLLGEVGEFNFGFLKLSEILAELQTNGFRYFQSDGQALIKNLTSIQELMRDMQNQIEKIRNTTANLEETVPVINEFKQIIDAEYIKYSSDLQMWDSGLSSLISILNSPTEKHLLLIFQNPAEIRPGGGFIGSYADLVVKDGQLQNIDVQDIYWPDHPQNLKLKVVPPEPLQTITEDWGARDANWFFDFPSSAKTVLGFLEASKIYAEPNIKFEGVIGLNINVLESILRLVGPINIEEYKMIIDDKNFLEELQREVETGRDKKPGSNPKRILKVLTPLILERLNQLSESNGTNLFEGLKNHLAKKDIMFFTRDANLAALFSEINLDGAVYKLPNNFWGSYLAVVNANIGGGKSDAFIDQTINARIDVDTDGGIFTDLNVIRTHRGDKEKDWWWRADNKNFIQIFANPGSSLVTLAGNTSRSKVSDFDYKALKYDVNSDLAAIENTSIFSPVYSASTAEAFGKSVFGTWFITPSGKTANLNMRYQTPASKEFVIKSGSSYTFIFEKQSGVKSALNFKIGAPLGYKWQESHSPVFEYKTEDSEGRIILTLTLLKG